MRGQSRRRTTDDTECTKKKHSEKMAKSKIGMGSNGTCYYKNESRVGSGKKAA